MPTLGEALPPTPECRLSLFLSSPLPGRGPTMNTPAGSRDQYEGYDLADFAQEFLRRNPEYRSQYFRLGSLPRRSPTSRRCREMAQGWGLRFSVPARSERDGCARDLAHRSRLVDRCSGTATSGRPRGNHPNPRRPEYPGRLQQRRRKASRARRRVTTASLVGPASRRAYANISNLGR